MSEGVFVVGMHRAGTSIATRLLGLLGLRLPVPEDLVPADARNPAGYWESMSLVALSERALRMVDSDARCPRRLAAGWERDPRLDELRREGRGAVRRAFGGVPWAWKDPRLCLAAAFWRSVIASERIPVVLLCRNPLEIAESAARADRPDGKLYTLALWERYLREALVQIGGLPVLVTRYDDLMRDPVRWCAEAASFLGRNGLVVQPADASLVTTLVDPTARSLSLELAELERDPAVSAAQCELASALDELTGEHSSFVAPALGPETPTTEALLSERRRALERERKLAAPSGLRRGWKDRVRRVPGLAALRARYVRWRSD